MSSGMRDVYIILTNTGTLLNRVIGLYTKDEYNHCSLSMVEDLSEMYSFGRVTPYNPFTGGFVKEDVYTGIYSYFPKTKTKILKLRVTHYGYKLMCEKIDAFESLRGELSYNLSGYLGVILDRPYEREDAYFCSQFVALTLIGAGVLSFEKSYSLVVPSDFEQLGLETVFEGYLYDYTSINTDNVVFKRYREHIPYYKKIRYIANRGIKL